MAAEEERCYDCGKVMQKATFDDMEGLIWMDAIQKYLCPECNKRRAAHVISVQ